MAAAGEKPMAVDTEIKLSDLARATFSSLPASGEIQPTSARSL